MLATVATELSSINKAEVKVHLLNRPERMRVELQRQLGASDTRSRSYNNGDLGGSNVALPPRSSAG